VVGVPSLLKKNPNWFPYVVKQELRLFSFKPESKVGEVTTEIGKLNPNYITGFTDGEGSFLVSIRRTSRLKIGYSVELSFRIKQHLANKILITRIKNYFGVGVIGDGSNNSLNYTVSSIKELQTIINHFDTYPLMTQKWADYQLFKQVFNLVRDKQHLSDQGLNKILSLKSALNLGLNDELKNAFPKLIHIERPFVSLNQIRDPYWFTGFVEGEGCFFVDIQKSTSKIGESPTLKFIVTQHERDTALLQSFIDFLGCGRYSKQYGKRAAAGYYVITKFSDIWEILIPFFDRYPLHGTKVKDFEDFKQVGSYINQKSHLTLEGLEKIKLIKSRMNTKRNLNAPFGPSDNALENN
jgi:hypothetical protein